MTQRNDKRILQITALPFPPEIRVMKEALSLRDAGYGSAVMCPPMKNRPAREQWNGIQIFRPESLRRAATAADKLMYHAAFFSPAWLQAMREAADDYRPHALHVHDIWLGRAAFRARRNERIVMDLHENMPAAVVEYQKGYTGASRIFNALFKRHGRVLRYERDLLRNSDLVLVVVEEARARVAEAHPALRPERLVNVENLESRNFLTAPATTPRLIADDHFSVLYIGGFGPHRGIDTLIQAMRHLKDRAANVRLHLVGAQDGSSYLAMLRELIAKLDVASHVNIVGWVPSDAVLAYISQASVGAVPHHSNAHTDSTIPHKLFQYMIAGTPVLVSTSAPLARTVRAASAGAIFNAGDAEDCARCIAELAVDSSRRADFAARGRRYVLEDGHNWEDESAPTLIAAYDRLFATELHS